MMEGFAKGVFPFFILCAILYFAFATIKPLFKDSFAQYVVQKVEEPDGRGFFIVHNIGCADYRQWYGREDKRSFVKHEYYVYCRWCVDMIDARQMNRISLERWESLEEMESDAEMLETSERMKTKECADNIYELIYVHDEEYNVRRATAEDVRFYNEFLGNRKFEYFMK